MVFVKTGVMLENQVEFSQENTQPTILGWNKVVTGPLRFNVIVNRFFTPIKPKPKTNFDFIPGVSTLTEYILDII